MRSEEFVGIGTRETGGDWLDLNPQPLFSSSEVMASFPLDKANETEAMRSKGGRPREIDWEAMRQLAEAALVEHPDLSRTKLADSLVSEYAEKVSPSPPHKRTIQKELAKWGMGRSGKTP